MSVTKSEDLRGEITVSNLAKHGIPRHAINPEQAITQATRATAALLADDPDDPIRGTPYRTGDEAAGQGWQGLEITGGHHRIYELIRRWRRGEIDGDTLVRIVFVAPD